MSVDKLGGSGVELGSTPVRLVVTTSSGADVSFGLTVLEGGCGVSSKSKSGGSIRIASTINSSSSSWYADKVIPSTTPEVSGASAISGVSAGWGCEGWWKSCVGTDAKWGMVDSSVARGVGFTVTGGLVVSSAGALAAETIGPSARTRSDVSSVRVIGSSTTGGIDSPTAEVTGSSAARETDSSIAVGSGESRRVEPATEVHTFGDVGERVMSVEVADSWPAQPSESNVPGARPPPIDLLLEALPGGASLSVGRIDGKSFDPFGRRAS